MVKCLKKHGLFETFCHVLTSWELHDIPTDGDKLFKIYASELFDIFIYISAN